MNTYIDTLKTLFPRIDLLTPNKSELEILLNTKIQTAADIQQAAKSILALGVKSVLIKGGHFNENSLSQDYWSDGNESFWISSKRFPSANVRGTGCALSSAITASLALGYEIKDAIVIGKMYINQGIRLACAINKAQHLAHLSWPENEEDLPFITTNKLHQLPTSRHTRFNENPELGIYPVVDSVEWIEKLLPLGVKTIQLRIKDKKNHEVTQEIQQAINIANQYNARLFINDYWELAIQHKAYGVHLGQEDLLTADIDKIHQAGLRLGVSTHCYYEVARAHALQPYYLACGPIFPTTSKIMPFQAQGIANLHRWRRTLNYPLVAIGGINQERIPEVRSTQVNGIAMISAITQAKDYITTTQTLLKMCHAES